MDFNDLSRLSGNNGFTATALFLDSSHLTDSELKNILKTKFDSSFHPSINQMNRGEVVDRLSDLIIKNKSANNFYKSRK